MVEIMVLPPRLVPRERAAKNLLPRRIRRSEGGGRGIRTHDELALIAVFKTAAIGH
jgi:hypothetical protein